MNISERCACSATFSIDDIRGEDIDSSVRTALGDFRSGHRCPSDSGGSMSAKPSSSSSPGAPVPF